MARPFHFELNGASEYARLGASVALGEDFVAAGAPSLGEDNTGVLVVHEWG